MSDWEREIHGLFEEARRKDREAYFAYPWSDNPDGEFYEDE